MTATLTVGLCVSKTLFHSFRLSGCSLCTLAETWAVLLCLLWSAAGLCGRGRKTSANVALSAVWCVSHLQTVPSEDKQPVCTHTECARSHPVNLRKHLTCGKISAVKLRKHFDAAETPIRHLRHQGEFVLFTTYQTSSPPVKWSQTSACCRCSSCLNVQKQLLHTFAFSPVDSPPLV